MLSLDKIPKDTRKNTQFYLQLWEVQGQLDTFEFPVPYRPLIKSHLSEQKKPYLTYLNFRFGNGVLASKDHSLHCYLDPCSVTIILSVKDGFKEESWETLISSQYEITFFCHNMAKAVAPIQTLTTSGPRIHPEYGITLYRQNWLGEFKDNEHIYWDSLVDRIRIKLNHSVRIPPIILRPIYPRKFLIPRKTTKTHPIPQDPVMLEGESLGGLPVLRLSTNSISNNISVVPEEPKPQDYSFMYEILNADHFGNVPEIGRTETVETAQENMEESVGEDESSEESSEEDSQKSIESEIDRDFENYPYFDHNYI